MRRSSRVKAAEAAKMPDAAHPTPPSPEKTTDTQPAQQTPDNSPKKMASSFDSPAQRSVVRTPASASKVTPQRISTHTPQKRVSVELRDDSDEEEILKQLKDSRPAKRIAAKSRKKSSVPFDSLDALLAENNKDQEKKKEQKERLEQLRKEAEMRTQLQHQSSALKQMSCEIETNIQELKADEHLFTIEGHVEVEEFGYVFEPISEPLVYRAYKASADNLRSPFHLAYKCMASTDDVQLGELLWSQGILLLANVLKANLPDGCEFFTRGVSSKHAWSCFEFVSWHKRVVFMRIRLSHVDENTERTCDG